MFEDAYKRQPLNEELGTQAFYANVRTGNWKTGQLVHLIRLLPNCHSAALLPVTPVMCVVLIDLLLFHTAGHEAQ